MKEEIIEILEMLTKNNTINEEAIPNIDLYIDQLTTFVEENIYSNKENMLTKSMINNYCKNKVIQTSVKKRYSKSHIMLLIIIYHTKSIISIGEIKNIFDSIDNEEITEYYNYLNKTTLEFNEKFITETIEDIDKIVGEGPLESEKGQIAILATKLAIESNYKKMLSEILIEKYLQE